MACPTLSARKFDTKRANKGLLCRVYSSVGISGLTRFSDGASSALSRPRLPRAGAGQAAARGAPLGRDGIAKSRLCLPGPACPSRVPGAPGASGRGWPPALARSPSRSSRGPLRRLGHPTPLLGSAWIRFPLCFPLSHLLAFSDRKIHLLPEMQNDALVQWSFSRRDSNSKQAFHFLRAGGRAKAGRRREALASFKSPPASSQRCKRSSLSWWSSEFNFRGGGRKWKANWML